MISENRQNLSQKYVSLIHIISSPFQMLYKVYMWVTLT